MADEDNNSTVVDSGVENLSLQDAHSKGPSMEERVRSLSLLSFADPSELAPRYLSFEPEEASTLLDGQSWFTVSQQPLLIYLLGPTFVSYFDFECSREVVHALNIQYADENGNVVSARMREIGRNTWRVNVGSIARFIEISTIPKLFSKAKANLYSIKMYGYVGPGTREWMTAFNEFSREVAFCRNSIYQEFEIVGAERSRLDSDREALKTERDEHESKIQAIRAQTREAQDELIEKQLLGEKLNQELLITRENLDRLRAEVSEVQAVQNEAREKHAAVTREMEQRFFMSNNLTAQIAEKRTKLEELNRDESLFAVNLKGYGTQGRRQSTSYFSIILVSILGIATVTLAGFNELNNIWDAIVADPQRITWSLIAITRFGMILIYTAALGGLTTMGYAFVRRLIQIHERALDLSAVSILARDVTDATLSDASDTQKMAIFHAARMSLVRNLLSGLFEKLAKANSEDREKEILKFKDLDIHSVLRLLTEKVIDAGKKD